MIGTVVSQFQVLLSMIQGKVRILGGGISSLSSLFYPQGGEKARGHGNVLARRMVSSAETIQPVQRSLITFIGVSLRKIT